MTDINIFLGGSEQKKESGLVEAVRKKRNKRLPKDHPEKDNGDMPRVVATSLLMRKLQENLEELKGKSDLAPSAG